MWHKVGDFSLCTQILYFSDVSYREFIFVLGTRRTAVLSTPRAYLPALRLLGHLGRFTYAAWGLSKAFSKAILLVSDH